METQDLMLPNTAHRIFEMKLPNTAHTSRPWRIHEIASDFDLEDVWALPTPGGPDDFPRLVRQFAAGDTSDNPSWAARMLFRIRWKLGELLGWEDPDSGVGSRVPTLRERLPSDLRNAPAGPEFPTLPFPLALPDRHRVGGRTGQPDRALGAAQ
jgi:hypothetical protein